MATVIGHFYVEWQLFAFVWAALIASSRILLGVHFLTDVLIGVLLGVGSAQFALIALGMNG